MNEDGPSPTTAAQMQARVQARAEQQREQLEAVTREQMQLLAQNLTANAIEFINDSKTRLAAAVNTTNSATQDDLIQIQATSEKISRQARAAFKWPIILAVLAVIALGLLAVQMFTAPQVATTTLERGNQSIQVIEKGNG